MPSQGIALESKEVKKGSLKGTGKCGGDRDWHSLPSRSQGCKRSKGGWEDRRKRCEPIESPWA